LTEGLKNSRRPSANGFREVIRPASSFESAEQ